MSIVLGGYNGPSPVMYNPNGPVSKQPGGAMMLSDINVTLKDTNPVATPTKSCTRSNIQCTPYFTADAKGLLLQVFREGGGTFLFVLIGLLGLSVYDPQTSPMAAVLAGSLAYYALILAVPHLAMNPAVTFAEFICPITPTAPPLEKQPPFSTGRTPDGPLEMLKDYGRDLLARGLRAVWVILCQLTGSVLAALFVWNVMVQPGTDAGARFNSHVRDDISDVSGGGSKVYWLEFFFSCLYAFIWFGVRYTLKKNSDEITCTTVQRRKSETQLTAIAAMNFLISSSMAPMFGGGGLNMCLSFGPILANLNVPAFYAATVFAQFTAFLAVAVVFRVVIHNVTRKCSDCMTQ